MNGFDRSRVTRRQILRGAPVAAIALGLGAGWPARCSGRIYPGAVALGIDLGGLSRASATERLRETLSAFEANAATFQWRDRRWPATAADLGMRVDYDATVRAAWRHGRDSGLLTRYATLVDQRAHRTAVAPILIIDEAVLTAFFDAIDREIARPPKDAQLRLDGRSVTIDPERPGARLKIDVAKRDTIAAVRSLAPTVVELKRQSVMPSITAADLEAVRSKGARLLSDEVTIVNGEAAWSISAEELAEALVFPAIGSPQVVRLDPARLTDALSPIVAEVNHPPHNATLAWDGGLYVLEPGTDGITVDLAQLAEEVAAAATTKERMVTLPVIVTAPAINESNLDTLGITTRLAQGASSFAGSSAARATNVSVAAYFVAQTLVAPGETFSFNEAIGAISVDKGYVEGKIISGDWYASDLGGGVCQVSTTVFRAALLAGLPFAEWHPHSFRLGFYELDGWPPGMDAAIYQPDSPDEWALDLQFTNPTDSWLLVQADIDGETLMVNLFGPPTNYEVDLSDPTFGETIPAPEPIERASSELPSGKREQVQIAQTEVEVTITRGVRQDGDVVQHDTFVSPYAPQAEVWTIGTGDS